MANQDQDDDGIYASATASKPERSSRRRKQALVGIVGLAAIVGGGAFFVTETVTGVSDVTGAIRGTGDLAPMTPVASPTEPSRSPSARPSATGSPASKRVAARVSRTASPSPSASLTIAEQIEAARAASAKDGFPLVPPMVAAQSVPPTVTTVGSLEKDGATMRVVSARYDLTGQRELAWAADAGVPVADAHCTQNFQFSGDGTARERPTMLLCWHTSAGKSVVTLAVTRQGRPSLSASVATIAEQWTKLG